MRSTTGLTRLGARIRPGGWSVDPLIDPSDHRIPQCGEAVDLAAGQDSEAIIATLEEAKVKLGEAQRHTFAGLTRLGKIRGAIEFTLGRLGRGNPAITLLRDAEKSIKDRAVEINGLSARVDKAIAEIRNAAGGGSGGPSSDPASSGATPGSRLPTQDVVAGDSGVLVHSDGGRDPATGGLDEPSYNRIEDRHGSRVAEGVDHNVQRMHDGSPTAVNHEIPGIGHDPDALGDYLADWQTRGMTHVDTKTGARVAYDTDRGVLLVQTPYRIHGYIYSQEAFEAGGRYVLP